MSNTETVIKSKTLVHVKEPPLFRVIFINDEFTTMEFVIESLIIIFHKTRNEAEELTFKIHKEGSAVVAILPFEIAEQKGLEVSILAKQNGFPLVVKLEADQ